MSGLEKVILLGENHEDTKKVQRYKIALKHFKPDVFTHESSNEKANQPRTNISDSCIDSFDFFTSSLTSSGEKIPVKFIDNAEEIDKSFFENLLNIPRFFFYGLKIRIQYGGKDYPDLNSLTLPKFMQNEVLLRDNFMISEILNLSGTIVHGGGGAHFFANYDNMYEKLKRKGQEQGFIVERYLLPEMDNL